MRKECAQTAITNTEGLRSPGTALTRNFTRVVCAKTATSTVIIRRKGKCYTLRIRRLKVRQRNVQLVLAMKLSKRIMKTDK